MINLPSGLKQTSLDNIKKEYILKVYQDQGQNQKKTCLILGISRTTLYRYLKRYGLTKVDVDLTIKKSRLKKLQKEKL